MCALVALCEMHKTTVSCASRILFAGICHIPCHETHEIPSSCISLFSGLGASTAAETLISICRPFWLEQAMPSFYLPTRLKCGQRPLVILGVFTVFGLDQKPGKHQGGKPLGAAVWASPRAGLPTTSALPTLIRPGAGGIGIISDSFAGLTPKPLNDSVKWM